MNIKRFIDLGIAADGGTIVCRVELSDGTEISIGLDGRIPKLKKDRILFLGTYPTAPGCRSFPQGSMEEADLIASIERYLDTHCGLLQREALAEALPTDMTEPELSDWVAVAFMRAIMDR